ncbi:DUF2510 domain-containing protein [Streptomyces sp. CRN 30]|uniref:DUF2510 domain-containing protein n=1 Tax=Streptomyces sp. CRN 30 TaxID=3075613 RepID=UPI002A8394C0|nr:DUF2510 domain-containing protein [Streptomyces sp. CRN 30]
MTQATPPGWYPDPGQTHDGPATERWWDGTAWTDRIRPAAPAGAAWGPPGPPSAAGPYAPYPAVPPYPAHPAPAGRQGLRTGIAVGVAAVVLACVGVGVYVLTANGGGSSASSASQGPDGRGGPGDERGGDPGPGGPGGGGPGEPTEPGVEDGLALDTVNGIGLPLPEDWSATITTTGVGITADDGYPCPGDTSSTCTPGGAYSAPAEALGVEATTAEAAAEEDIARNAEESYGGASYGSITSHEELFSKAATVAGQQGWAVRWQVVTEQGADGYVESLVVPAPADPDRLVVIRFGVDVGDSGPGQSVIDEIREGIEEISGGGSGRDV